MAALVLAPYTQAATNTIYLGSNNPGGIFKSNDAGATWAPSNTGLPPYFSWAVTPVTALAVDPSNSNIIYAGTPGLGIFKSVNAGASWTSASIGLATSGPINRIVVDPTNPNVLYIAGGGPITNFGVYKSTNAGATWSAMNTGLLPDVGNLSGQDIALHGSAPNTLFAAGNTGFCSVCKSTDGAATWSLSSPGSFHFGVAIDPAVPATVYGMGPFGLYKTTDNGASWVSLPSPPGIEFVMAIDPAAHNTAYIGGQGGLHKSIDGFASFSPTSIVTTVEDIAIDPSDSNILFAGTHTEALKSVDGGTTWTIANPTNDVRAIAFAPPAFSTTVTTLAAILAEIAPPASTLTSSQYADLVNKLNHVATSIDDGKKTAACGQLKAFKNEVNSFVSNQYITAAEVNSLLSMANGLASALGCKNQ